MSPTAPLLGYLLFGLMIVGCGQEKTDNTLFTDGTLTSSAPLDRPFATIGEEFNMSVECSHHSTQITLHVYKDSLWLRYTTTRWDTLVLDYATHVITREVQSSETPTFLSNTVEPPDRGGDSQEYHLHLVEFLVSTNLLISGNACTVARPELDEVRIYLMKLMPATTTTQTP